VDAPLVPLRLDNAGELEAPKDYDIPGWYAEGTPPGDTGPAVIAGHVDSLAASAVFRHLADLRPGDLIEVQRAGVWLKFTVVSAGRYPKGAFPTAEVYGPTPDPQLRVITCGGPFDRARNSYRDNVVVFAIMKSNDY
jgi:sortase (surface protein transpeptidase)